MSPPLSFKVKVTGTGVVPVLPPPDTELLHFNGFGSLLHGHVASAPEGPWTSTASVGTCDLPADDPDAYCAGVAVHEALRDPTSRDLVTYGVATSAPGRMTRDPEK